MLYKALIFRLSCWRIQQEGLSRNYPERGLREVSDISVFDVPAGAVISAVAADLKGKLEKPAFTAWIKSGAHRERAPLDKEWWYVRSASILYRVYKDGPVGTESLRTYYGGKRNRGSRPHHFRKASGKVVRTCLQGLEKEGLIKKLGKGRGITPKGQKYLNDKAKEVSVVYRKGRDDLAEKKKGIQAERRRMFVKKADVIAAEKPSHEGKEAAKKGGKGTQIAKAGKPEGDTPSKKDAEKPVKEAPSREKKGAKNE